MIFFSLKLLDTKLLFGPSMLHSLHITYFALLLLIVRGGVEDTRLEAKDTKKIRGQGQGQPFRDRTSRSQGHRRKRSPKKKVFKIFFQAISNLLTYPEFLIGGGLNHKSHEMTSPKFFQTESTCGTKLS